MALASVLSMMATPQVTSGYCGKNNLTDIRWSLDTISGHLSFTGSGEMKDFSRSFTDVPWRRSTIQSVLLNAGITSIGAYAFYECENLSSLTLCSSLVKINGEAFNRCTSLASVTLPASLTTISEEAFLGCTQLATINGGANVTTIRYGAFQNTALVNVTNFVSASDVGFRAFRDCQSLKEVSFPSITRLEADLFYGCTRLEKACFGPDLNMVEGGVFYNCDALLNSSSYIQFDGITPPVAVNVSVDAANMFNKSEESLSTVVLRVPNGALLAYGNDALWGVLNVTSVDGNGGFCGKTNERDVVWTYNANDNCVTISGSGDMADYYAQSRPAPWSNRTVQEVYVNENITAIGNYAFAHQSELSTITLPSSLLTIGNAAFGYAQSDKLKSIHIPSSVKTLGREVFFECYGLRTVTGGENVTDIRARAFRQTDVLQVDNFTSATIIGEQAFAYCSRLGVVRFPAVTAIGSESFSGCTALYNARFGADLQQVDRMAFFNCESLHLTGHLQFDAVVPPSLVSDTITAAGLFNEDETLLGMRTSLYVPSGSVGAYSQHPVWGKLIVTARPNTHITELHAGTDFTLVDGVLNFDAPTTYELYDSNGRLVGKGHAASVSLTQPAGIYLLHTEHGTAKLKL